MIGMNLKKTSKKVKPVKKAIRSEKITRVVFRKKLLRLVIFVMVAITALFFVNNFLNLEQVYEEKYEETVYYYDNSTPVIVGQPGTSHHHSTFLIFINGKLKRFDEARYFAASPYAHIHDYSFAEIHTHAVNVTLGYFLETIGIKFNSTCLVFSINESYCNNETSTLKFYAEGSLNHEFGHRLTADWEHYLITYGDESEEEIAKQLRRVPDPLASPPPDEGESEFRPNYESL